MKMKKEIKKFVIVTPRAVSPAGTPPRIHPPLGAISVLAEAKRAGYRVALFDVAAEGLKKSLFDPKYNPVEEEILDGVRYWKTGLRMKEVAEKIAELEPDVIGISCCTVVDRGETARIAKTLKQTFPEIPLILGGHEASQWFREILGETIYPIDVIPEIDYVVVGPGQPVIVPLLKYLSDPNSNPLPLGVAYRGKDRHVIYTGEPPFDPNKFALPDYSLLPSLYLPNRQKPIDIYSYIGNPHAGHISVFLRTSKKTISYLPIFTSYGCGLSCSFCDTDKRLRRYTIANVIKVIEEFEELYGIDYIDFMDNNFAGGDNTSREIAFGILKEIKAKRYQIGFSNGLTFESMMREDFRLLRQFAKDGNVRHIAFPVENGNERVLRMIRKPHNLQMVRKTLEFAKKELYDTNREGFFIGGFPETNGQPAETPEELENTYRFIKECLEKEWLNQAIFLTLSPVTREYRMMWRRLHPEAPFEHCLFSRNTKIWPYPNELLEEMHRRVEILNRELGREITRKL